MRQRDRETERQIDKKKKIETKTQKETVRGTKRQGQRETEWYRGRKKQSMNFNKTSFYVECDRPKVVAPFVIVAAVVSASSAAAAHVHVPV